MRAMESKIDLKYQKRAWHKMSAKIFSTADIGYGKIEVVVYKGKHQIRFACYTKIKSDALLLAPHEKINLWFKVESKLHKGKWYNDLWLMHFEPAKVKLGKPTEFTEPTQDEPSESLLFKFGRKEFE